ncbi:ADP-ribose pyrophosphatase YjhB, NUDIX family [Asanoa hainanensis]|uniref:ADP-ribose pyrophosphatase YjhB, NUDIX family n=1 Tax=Asanoa hainanensis TaxID=560556 RepID=A0A239I253_9ACTN|nr:NUDIX domain-containing protein [Asanoa hainanensis]SNS87599.1 ADP-ribose pyrophosphatase YjhB, NUDIX family [Asanoa hainanensis]
MERRRRIGAYGLCRDGDRVLLARSSDKSDFPGVWQIPGGGLEHGEAPAHALVREYREETGLEIEIGRPLTALASVRELRDIDVVWHYDLIVYEVTVLRGTLRSEAAGTSDDVAWVDQRDLADLRLMPFTAELLGQPVVPLDFVAPHPLGRRRPPPPLRTDRGQRFAAYGLVTSPRGVLLTKISEGFPGAGKWHLPGGGTDFGEQPAAGLLRELAEESGQVGEVVELLGVSDRHNPRAIGPEPHPMDWHAVRVIYRVAVPVPTEPRVAEVGGSTVDAAWFTRDELRGLTLTDVAATATEAWAA